MNYKKAVILLLIILLSMSVNAFAQESVYNINSEYSDLAVNSGTAAGEKDTVFFVGLSLGVEFAQMRELEDGYITYAAEEGMLTGGNLRFLSDNFGIGFTYLKSDHNTEHWSVHSYDLNYTTLDLLFRLGDRSSAALPYAMLSIGRLKEDVSVTNWDNDSIEDKSSSNKVFSLGVGIFSLIESGTGLSFNGELRYAFVNGSENFDNTIQAYFSLGLMFR